MFKSKNPLATLTLGAALLIPTLVPATAAAQDGRDRDSREFRRDQDRVRRDVRARREDRWRDRDDRRQDTKNEWRNLGIAGGVVGVAGLLTHSDSLAALGLGGGLYSAYRYEQDRRSQNAWERNRYELFRRPTFDDHGHRDVRHDRWNDGQRSYVFSRAW